MSLTGWNDIPSNAITKFDFDQASSWLKFLARVPFFERFSYPIVVKKGLATIWFEDDIEKYQDYFFNSGWHVKRGIPSELDLFQQGSLAQLSNHPLPFRKPKFAITRLGKELAWRKAVHRSNGTLEYLRSKTSPFNRSSQ